MKFTSQVNTTRQQRPRAVSATSSDLSAQRAVLTGNRAAVPMPPPVREGAHSMKIYGDTNSGNCLKVKWVCDNLALPYSWIDVDTLKGETRTHGIPQAQQRRPGADGRIRRRPHAGAIQRHHPLSRPRQRPDPAGRLCRREDGRMAVLGAIQPRALYRGVPLPDGLSGQAGLRSRSRQDQARLCRAGADGASARRLAVSWSAMPSRSPTCRCWPIRALAHEGGFHLDGYAAVRRWIGETEKSLGLPPAR